MRVLGFPVRVWRTLAVVTGILITFVSMLPPRGTPGPQIADLGEVLATLGHVLSYLLLAAFIVIGWGRSRPRVVWIAVSAYGALIETVQGAVGLRSFQWTDMIANALGAAVGVALGLGLVRWWPQRAARRARDECVDDAA